MVADGDVERVAHPGDGRSHLVRLTDAGRRALEAGLAGAPADDRARSPTNLDRPVDEVEDALEDLIEALRKAATAPTPIS